LNNNKERLKKPITDYDEFSLSLQTFYVKNTCLT